MHAFLRNLATDRQTDRQADKQTRAKTCNMYTSSFVGGKLEVVVVDTALHDQIKAIGNSRSGIPGNFTKKSGLSNIFVQNGDKIGLQEKFASFASVICITKAHVDCSSHLQTLQGQPDATGPCPTYCIQ